MASWWVLRRVKKKVRKAEQMVDFCRRKGLDSTAELFEEDVRRARRAYRELKQDMDLPTVEHGSIAHYWGKTWRHFVSFFVGAVWGVIISVEMEYWMTAALGLAVAIPYIALQDHWYRNGKI